jgi:hypothetical protein
VRSLAPLIVCAQAASPPPGFVSWHVRHGDKVVERFQTFEAEAFLADVTGITGG